MISDLLTRCEGEQQILYIQMEYCPGKSLRDMIDDGKVHSHESHIKSTS